MPIENHFNEENVPLFYSCRVKIGDLQLPVRRTNMTTFKITKLSLLFKLDIYGHHVLRSVQPNYRPKWRRQRKLIGDLMLSIALSELFLNRESA